MDQWFGGKHEAERRHPLGLAIWIAIAAFVVGLLVVIGWAAFG